MRKRIRREEIIHAFVYDRFDALNALEGVFCPQEPLFEPNLWQKSALHRLRMLGEKASRRGLARLEMAPVVGVGGAYNQMLLEEDIWAELDRIQLLRNKVAGMANFMG